MEVILGSRVIKQPLPMINDGGDCGACIIGGLLNYLKGSDSDKVQSVYDIYFEQQAKSITYPGMITALYRAQAHGHIREILSDVPTWYSYSGTAQWGSPGWSMHLEWFMYMKMAIRAGYYGLAMVTSEGQGFESEIDHWVLICGFREREVPNPNTKNSKDPVLRKSKIITQEILISNSSSKAEDEYWIDAREFLKQFGGYNTILVLP